MKALTTVTAVSRRANLCSPPACFLPLRERGDDERWEDAQLPERPDGGLVELQRAGGVGHVGHVLGQAGVERLSDLLGLADAAALDDDVVELLQLGQADQLLEQVAAEGAADATVLQGDDLFIGPGQPVRLADEGGVDVDAGARVRASTGSEASGRSRSNVVDGDAQPMVAAQDVLEQRRLAGALPGSAVPRLRALRRLLTRNPDKSVTGRGLRGTCALGPFLALLTDVDLVLLRRFVMATSQGGVPGLRSESRAVPIHLGDMQTYICS